MQWSSIKLHCSDFSHSCLISVCILCAGVSQTTRDHLDSEFSGLWCAHLVRQLLSSLIRLMFNLYTKEVFVLSTRLLWSCLICVSVSLTGGIPGPIAFGSVIDISCLLWQDQCGEQGSCYLYQNSAMSRYTLVAGIIYKVQQYWYTDHISTQIHFYISHVF